MTSRPDFDAKTTADEVLSAFGSEVTSKTILITGVSPNSVGEATVMAIAQYNPALLILASRTAANISVVIAKIAANYPSVPLRALNLDLASLSSVRAAAAEVLSYTETSIDIIINNAGIMDLRPTRSLSSNGFENHLAINHLGSFLFTNLILRKIKAASHGRVIVVASSAAMISPFRFSDYNVEKCATDVPESEQPALPMLQYLQIPTDTEYIAWVAYGASKTGTILTSIKWADDLKKDGVTVLSLHPGAIRTNLQRTTTEADLGLAVSMFWKTPSQGASTTLVAAFDPALKGSSGAYLDNCQVTQAPAYATDRQLAEKLWKLSEQLVGEEFIL